MKHKQSDCNSAPEHRKMSLLPNPRHKYRMVMLRLHAKHTGSCGKTMVAESQSSTVMGKHLKMDAKRSHTWGRDCIGFSPKFRQHICLVYLGHNTAMAATREVMEGPGGGGKGSGTQVCVPTMA